MKSSPYLAIGLALFIVFSVLINTSFGQGPGFAGVPASGAQTLLGPFNLNSTNVYAYAFFFALIVFFILNYALKGTTLSSGGSVISMLFGAITFIFLVSNPSFIGSLLDIGFLAFAVIFLLFLMFTRWSKISPARRVISAIIIAVGGVLFLENYPAAANAVSSVVHFNIVPALSAVLDIIIILGIVYGLFKVLLSSRGGIGVKLLLVLGIMFFILLLVPGFASFLFSPLVLALLVVIIVLLLFTTFRIGRYTPRYEKEDKGVSSKYAKSKPNDRPFPNKSEDLKALPYVSDKEAKKRGITIFDSSALPNKSEDLKALPYVSDKEAKKRGIKILGRSSKKLSRAERNQRYNEGVVNYEREYKKIFSCPICGAPAPSKPALQTHIVNAHPDYYEKHKARYEGFWNTRREKKIAKDEKKYKEDIKQYKY
ncbi:MAG: DMT family transporter [Candidatus Parvarchaeota archaeon]|nr:DMT family transporter [Candidatus Parvarchaeota archaeon]